MRPSFKIRHKKKTAISYLLRGLMVVAASWLVGLLWFCLTIPSEQTLPLDRQIDAIVVFTGSSGRIHAGLKALEAGIGERLLVSGVNPELAPALIRSTLPGDSRLVSCCIDLGRVARDTEGNAAEAVAWAQQHGYQTIMLVTTDWHMRRSLVEMSRHKERPKLFAAPVKSDASFKRLVIEYNKFLAAKGRALLI